jgi:hypothetical protein
MISTGQLIFAIVFVIVFVTILYISYKKDRALHRKHYRGIIWKILVGFLAFMGLMLLAKWYLK